jgi:hypothetical protein
MHSFRTLYVARTADATFFYPCPMTRARHMARDTAGRDVIALGVVHVG